MKQYWTESLIHICGTTGRLINNDSEFARVVARGESVDKPLPEPKYRSSTINISPMNGENIFDFMINCIYDCVCFCSWVMFWEFISAPKSKSCCIILYSQQKPVETNGALAWLQSGLWRLNIFNWLQRKWTREIVIGIFSNHTIRR